ncbi:xylulokinase [Streptomyces sp. LHD-70]|uniref:xylulokinase n=1 Tax=Streptomyces sp. LHD-70 TaxID=3072140 RepID=UPI00280DD2DC|nr:xylulokinase [Streptomyces sp. LHD-70]MDQ8703785.1 xylulokinase [Streptomyces sp. LHD-70]
MSAADGPLVVGVDSSTQSTKVLVVDAATGRVVASGQAPHTVSSGAGRESDPEQWWEALVEALRQCGDAAHEAAAVSVGGQQHGLVTLGADGRPVRPALLWNDVRSAPQAARLVEELGGAQWWAGRIGSVPAPAFTAPKWAWLREHEPEAAAATKAVRLPHDYLTERLTGEATTDRGDASGTGWWAAATESYDTDVLSAVGLDPALLPRVVRPGEVAGTVRGRAELPFSKGVLVAAGTGDNAAAALGLGLRPGTPVLSLGTSGTVYAVSRERPADPSGTVAGFADARGDWLPLACTLNCTLAVDRVAALLGLDREAVEPGGGATFLPFLDGERTPNLPTASGLLHGLRHDTSGGQVLQAAYDGAAFALLRALDLVLGGKADPPSQTGPAGRAGQAGLAGHAGRAGQAGHAGDACTGEGAPLLLIGGGARGTAWQQTVRRLSGRAVQVPEARELVALGAAAQAAGLLTGEDPAAVARRWDTARGTLLEPVRRDEETLERLGAVLDGAGPLLGAPGRSLGERQ